MSDEEQSNVNSEQQQEEGEQNSEQEQEGEDEDEDEDDDEEQSGSGDEDQDEQDEDEEQDEDQEQGSGEDDQSGQEGSKSQQQQQNKKLPTFKMVNRQQPDQFKFTSLLSQISNLSCSVDSFIGTLHTSEGTAASRRPYTNSYAVQQRSYQPQIQSIKIPEPPVQSRVVIMKDNDAQVDMKPQIIIQPTKPLKQEPIVQAKPYKISTQSEKFLAQLYQENKKLKRWQVNPNHPMNSYMTSFSNSNGFGNSSKGFYNSKDKFERKQYEKGVFNVEQRNRQIDQAIMMLKKEEEEQY